MLGLALFKDKSIILSDEEKIVIEISLKHFLETIESQAGWEQRRKELVRGLLEKVEAADVVVVD